MNNTGYTTLIQKLDGFIRKYYKNQLIKGGLLTVSVSLLFYLLVVVLEYFGHFGIGMRTFLFYAFLLSTGIILARLVAIPLLKLYRIGKMISHDQAAEIIGKHFHAVNDKLINTLQLKRQLEDQPAQASLIEASIDQRMAELKPVRFTSAIDFRQNRRYLKFVLPPVLTFLVLLFAAPSIITEGTQRLMEYSEPFDSKDALLFTIENDALQVVQQEDFDLMVKVEGESLPSEVYIQFENDQVKLKKVSNNRFLYPFKNVKKTTSFQLSAGDVTSRSFELVALPKPLLMNFDIDLDYPAYIGKKDESIANTGDLLIPEGTKVKWKFKTKNTENFRIRFVDSTYTLDASQSDTYVFSKNLFRSQNYSLSTLNQHIKTPDSIAYRINVVKDLYPEIAVEERADSLSSKRLYFRGRAKDDYGFTSLRFNYRFVDRNEGESKPWEGSNIFINNNLTQEQFYHVWDLNDLNIQAGDEVEYFFEVWDNDGVNGSKSSKTPMKVFKAPTQDELAQKTEQNNQQIKDNIESTIENVQDIQQDLEKLQQKLLEKKKLDWQDKKQLRDLLEKQKALEKAVDEIKKENEKNLFEQNEYNEANEKILEKQKQLEELFNEVMTDEMKELFEQLEELMDEVNKQDLQKMLEDVQLSNEDIEKELDRTLEIFKQLEFEQKLEEVAEKARELAEKEKELSEETKDKNSDPEEQSEKQKELQEEFNELQKEMDDLEKKNQELERPNKMEDTEQQEDQANEEMNNSQEQLQKNQKKKASESQKKAAQEMEKMAQSLEQMQSSMQMEQQTEDLDALRALLENLVQLSFDQEDLMLELNKTNRNDPKYTGLTQQQKKMKDDAKLIQDSLFALSKRVSQIEAVVNREISSINANMNKAISLMSDQPPRREQEYIRKAVGRQQYVMTSINNLALLLDEVVQQMQAQMSQNMFGSSSCNKPGQSKPGQTGKANMKSMQQQLNKAIEDLQKQMGKEGKKPGQGMGMGQSGMGGKKMSKELAKLAAQQEALRRQIQQMANDLEGEGNIGGAQQLKKLAELMEETETDLVNRNIRRETLERQKEIMTRLLESDRAERERDKDDKRKSKEAEEVIHSNPADYFEYQKSREKEIELLKTVPPTLNPFYKRKVNEYFNGFDN